MPKEISDREDRPAQLLQMARNHQSLSDEINSMDPIDRRIHMDRMARLAKEQENNPNLAKVEIVMDKQGNPLDISVKEKSTWGQLRHGKSDDVYDTAQEIEKKKAGVKKPDETKPEDPRKPINDLARSITTLEVPVLADWVRLAQRVSRRNEEVGAEAK